MAALNRLTEATYEVHETVKVDTQDNEDHTFCGIMFPVKCKDLLPVDHIAIRSLAVRGQLGPMSVWVSNAPKDKTNTNSNNRNNNTAAAAASRGTTTTRGSCNNNNTSSTATASTSRNGRATTVFKLSPSHWTKVYEAVHPPSPNTYSSMVLDQPIILKPGQVRAIYIHSTLPGDAAIVYDNASFYLPRRGLHPFGGAHNAVGHHNHNTTTRSPRYEDAMLSVYTGRAHVSNSPFGQMPIWGWGNAWRDHREFVGTLEYGAVYQLWNPETQTQFGPKFKDTLFNLKLCQTRWESPVSRLPDECIYYILNMCRWDWFQDTQQSMELQQRQQLLKLKQKEQEQQQQQLQQLQLEQQQAQQLGAATGTAAAAAAPSAGSGHNQRQLSCQGGGPTCAGTSTTNTTYRCNNDADDDDDDDSDADYQDAVEDHQAEEDHHHDDSSNNNIGQDGDDDDDGGVVVMDDGADDESFDDEEEWDEDDEDDDDDDDEEEDDEDEEFERANGYRADHNVFRFVDPDHEEDGDDDDDNNGGSDSGPARQAWIRRQFERIHVLRALAREQDDDDDVVDMHLVF